MSKFNCRVRQSPAGLGFSQLGARITCSTSRPTLLFDKVNSTEKELVFVPGSHFALAIGQQAVHDLWPRELNWSARH